MTKEQIAEINRCLGMLEGLSYFVKDDGIANGMINAIERIENVIKEVESNEAD